MIRISRARDSAASKSAEWVATEHYQALVSWICGSKIQLTALTAQTIGVTSCSPGAGVSTVAMNLAVAAAQVCARPTLLIDLSCSRSTAAARLGMSGDLGLRKALECESSAWEYATPSPVPNLSVLAMDDPGVPQVITAEGTKLSNLIHGLEGEFEFIVVDLPSTDSGLCFAVGGALTGVLLVLEARRTVTEAALRAKHRLMHANAEILGVIMTKCTS